MTLEEFLEKFENASSTRAKTEIVVSMEAQERYFYEAIF